jgi:hypothetical protein
MSNSLEVLQAIRQRWELDSPEMRRALDDTDSIAEAPAIPASAKVAADVARLKEIMSRYPIRPFLNECGGDGFSYPVNEPGWSANHWGLICEFSDLWFSPAGTAIIAEHGHLMRTIPAADWRKPVRVQFWRSERDAALDLSRIPAYRESAVASVQPGGSF